jgi:hypothetical protein
MQEFVVVHVWLLIAAIYVDTNLLGLQT